MLSSLSGMVVPESPTDTPAIGPVAGPGLPPRLQPALACGPSGEAWAFGGLRDAGGAAASAWQPTADLSAIVLQKAGGGGGLNMQVGALQPAKGAAWPPARSSAALVYLPPAAVGLKRGALLLYGGTTTTDPELNTLYVDKLDGAPLLDDAWLYDLATGGWTRLAPNGARPPPMMWHSMAADGGRVLLYGGKTYNATARAWNRDTNLYILQLPEMTWQAAPVTNHLMGSALKTEFPNSGVAPMGDVLALQFERVGAGWLVG